MRVKSAQFALITLISSLVSCSTTEVAPPPPPVPPNYTQVPHPAGPDTADLASMFRSPLAPQIETFKECDSDFKKLSLITHSLDEIRDGARELVAADPVKYHWCFYSKVLELNGVLKGDNYVDERQKSALDTYNFLVPVARGFLTQFQDSRYLRYSVTHYRRLSEWIFFRKLDMTPQTTSELVDAANPFGLYRTPADTISILQKYAIEHGPVAIGEPAPSGSASVGAPSGASQASVAPPPTAPAGPIAGEAAAPSAVATAPSGASEPNRTPAAAPSSFPAVEPEASSAPAPVASPTQ